jgi:hypothetical protein
MKEQPTCWVLGWSLNPEIGFADGKYLPREAALLLYPEYFDADGKPKLDMLPLDKPKDKPEKDQNILIKMMNKILKGRY